MIQLAEHNDFLRKLISTSDKMLLDQAIDLDSFDMILREYLLIDDMRESGCFFTGQDLARKVIGSLKKPISSDSIVLDPTCGAGNLLIECSRGLKVCETLSATLELWGKVLWGFDLYSSFIEAAKLRLIVEAIRRGAHNDCEIEDAFDLMPNIRVQDALSVTCDDLSPVTHSIMNPPFTIWNSPRNNYWKNGKVNAAGVVFDLYLRMFPEDCNLSAVLPDVLRSGSRYAEFRRFVETKINGMCSIWGRFNAKTDVDVFILSGVILEKSVGKINWGPDMAGYLSLAEIYDVCVGPLVSYRDPEEGPEYPYFHPKNSIAWTTISKETELRRFKGRVLMPPFVVVKRTSSPSDKYRASATIINLKKHVAVENHMIVIQPKSKSLADCQRLLEVLRSDKTNDFLNDRIRLRHLTVSAIKDIPLD